MKGASHGDRRDRSGRGAGAGRAKKGADRLRLTGGTHRGRWITVPNSARPTEARVREALFSIWGPESVEGARLLDLFAGSGSIGLEAASRGAMRVLAVEDDRLAMSALAGNRDRLELRGVVDLARGRLPEYLTDLARREGNRFDLIFADPPYRAGNVVALLEAAEPLLATAGEVVVEHDAKATTPAEVGRLVRTQTRRYGECGLSFYRRLGDGGRSDRVDREFER